MTMNSVTREDYKLWLHLLKRANDGISMNNIVERLPTNIYISDSFPVSLGGMLIHERDWRYHIPRPPKGRISNNNREYIAEIITIWIDIIEGRMEKEDCVLALFDSSSTIGWNFK